ncbi:hypothetical protein [Ferviditalea candida]|uniref:hypothetical protein n=1 Tax=Ferviditalea candida TaxID=3108399 RepID=UPI00352E1246
MKIENQRALIVNPISREMDETRKEFYFAYCVSNMPSNLEVGQYVDVWFENDKSMTKNHQFGRFDSRMQVLRIAQQKNPTVVYQSICCMH